MAMAAGAALTPGCATGLPGRFIAPGVFERDEIESRFSARRLQTDLEKYVSFGIHRSGSQADRQTADWLAAGWRAGGYDVEFQPFDAPDHDALFAELEAQGQTLTLLAQPPFPEVANAVVNAPLVAVDEHGPRRDVRGAIMLAEAPHMRASSYESEPFRRLADMALAGGARALVIATHGPTGDAVFLNISPDRAYPVTAIASPEQGKRLKQLAENGQSARLTMPPEKPLRIARNVIARRGGDAETIVITTPISGWTTCAGERAPGVAIIRALSPWLAEAFPEKSIVLAGLSGHELEGLGVRLFLEHEAPPRESVALWLHLGAGIAARDWHETSFGLLPLNSADPQRFLLAPPSLSAAIAPHVKTLPGLERVYELTRDTAAGDLKEIHHAGYATVFGAFGAHRYHHSLRDQIEMTSGELVEPIARAFRDSIISVASTM